jgi:hypothetical protein
MLAQCAIVVSSKVIFGQLAQRGQKGTSGSLRKQTSTLLMLLERNYMGNLGRPLSQNPENQLLLERGR